jgi:hypothetical protein
MDEKNGIKRAGFVPSLGFEHRIGWIHAKERTSQAIIGC